MRQDDTLVRCRWCHRPLAAVSGIGRPRQYCRPSHRQRAYEARKRAERLALAPGDVVVAKAELDRLHDRLYRLEAALDDVDADLASDRSPARWQAAFHHLAEAARDLYGYTVEPAG